MPDKTQGEKISDLQAWRAVAEYQLAQINTQVQAVENDGLDHDRRLIVIEQWKAEVTSSRDEWGKRVWNLTQAFLLLAAGSLITYLVKR